MVEYGGYKHLIIEKSDGIALVTMNRPEVLNAANFRMHHELGRIWLDLADDDEVRVAVITGAGNAFSAGGDFEMVGEAIGNPEVVASNMKEAADIVYNMMNLDKPIVSAINGVAVGAGLAVALLADISVASEKARFTDGHIRLGVAAGDHAALIWPLLCGMAKAKYYLLTSDFLDGKEAERIGLVSMVVPHEELISSAMEVAHKLSTGPQPAIRWTKHALNHWLHLGRPAFEYSLAVEMLGFFGADLHEGLQSVREKRSAKFPSVQPPDSPDN